jgi:hypothetical protein
MITSLRFEIQVAGCHRIPVLHQEILPERAPSGRRLSRRWQAQCRLWISNGGRQIPRIFTIHLKFLVAVRAQALEIKMEIPANTIDRVDFGFPGNPFVRT